MKKWYGNIKALENFKYQGCYNPTSFFDEGSLCIAMMTMDDGAHAMVLQWLHDADVVAGDELHINLGLNKIRVVVKPYFCRTTKDLKTEISNGSYKYFTLSLDNLEQIYDMELMLTQAGFEEFDSYYYPVININGYRSYKK